MSYEPSQLEKAVWDYVNASVDDDVSIAYAHQDGAVPSKPFVLIQADEESQIGHATIEYGEETEPGYIEKTITTEHESDFIVSVYADGSAKDMLRKILKSQHETDISLVLHESGIRIRDYDPISMVYEQMETDTVQKAVTTMLVAYRHRVETEERYIEEVTATGKQDLEGLVITETL